MVQSAPYNYNHFLIFVLSIRVLIISDSSTRFLCSGCSRHLVAKQEGTGREMAGKFGLSVYLPYLRGFLGCLKTYDMGTTALLPLRMKSCSVGFEPQTFSPVARTAVVIVSKHVWTCWQLRIVNTYLQPAVQYMMDRIQFFTYSSAVSSVRVSGRLRTIWITSTEPRT
jgi:hypothetical protein